MDILQLKEMGLFDIFYTDFKLKEFSPFNTSEEQMDWVDNLSFSEKMKYYEKLNKKDFNSDIERWKLFVTIDQNNRLILFRDTNETVDELKNRIRNLRTEIKERVLNYLTQTGKGLYFYATRESMPIWKLYSHAGGNNTFKTSISVEKCAFPIDILFYRDEIVHFFEKNKERLLKLANLEDSSASMYLENFMIEMFFIEKHQKYKAIFFDADDVCFFGEIKDLDKFVKIIEKE